jgi:dimethylglycine dehydrogenase
VPQQGRIVLDPMLNPQGKLIGDFTVGRTGPERFMVFGSGVAEQSHMRWFEAQLPDDGVAIRSLRTELLGFAIPGPRSRELLQRLTSEDVSNESFPFLSIRPMELGLIPATVGRISFTGELGYEIWVPADYQLALYDLLTCAGVNLGIQPYGARALTSMRLEKSFGNWAREFRPIYGPLEAGLDRFIAFDKGDFIGRNAVLKEREEGPQRRLVTLVIDDDGVDAIGDEPVFHEGTAVGWITSGGYGHRVDKSLALAYLPAGLEQARNGIEVDILGQRRAARILPKPIYDPDGRNMRS